MLFRRFTNIQADRGFAAQVAGQCCCLGLLGLLCCDHDDHVVCFRTTATGIQCLFYVRNPSASQKWLSCLWMFTKWVLWSSGWVCNFGGFVSFLAGLFGFILAGTDIRSHTWTILVDKNSIRWTILCLRHTDTRTYGHTDTLIFFISIDIKSL